MRKQFFIIFVLLIITLSACASPTPTDYPDEVDWATAVEILNTGAVETIFQTHNLDVILIMKDEQTIHTVEPSIDAIFDEVEKCGQPCSDIVLATE